MRTGDAANPGVEPGPAEARRARRSADNGSASNLAVSGAGIAFGGFVVGLVIAGWAVAGWHAATHTHGQTYGTDVVGLLGLWMGMIGASVVYLRVRGGRLVTTFGLRIELPRDIPLGLACGLASQFLLVPALYVPFRVFSPRLYHELGRPARALAHRAHGPGFVVLAVLVVVGAPIIEEIFFRGLLQRSLVGALGAAPAIGTAALAFGLAHGEVVQLLALVAFGAVLGLLARRFQRLGPGIVAHAAFNGATIAVLALSR